MSSIEEFYKKHPTITPTSKWRYVNDNREIPIIDDDDNKTDRDSLVILYKFKNIEDDYSEIDDYVNSLGEMLKKVFPEKEGYYLSYGIDFYRQENQPMLVEIQLFYSKFPNVSDWMIVD